MVRLCVLCKTGKLGALAYKGAFYPEDIEGLTQAEENCSAYPLFAEVSGYPINEAGKPQGRATPGSKQKLFIPQQTALAYLMYDPCQ
jgi:hypothetical protein